MEPKDNFIKSFFVMMILFFIIPIFLQGQQIIIDKPIKAGELTLFPNMEDENIYYYLPDQLRLATDNNGNPQFSFLRYVENVRSAPGETEIREGTGGGIVHAVVSLSVSPEQIAEAKNELRQINPEGVIAGPVIYSGGTMAIISSFVNTEGDLSKQVVGIGKAPLIDGQKAAISIELTKKGAEILWESFKTPTPDMSFSFEMDMQGYRSPKKAIIEADFEKIYNHQGFQAGVAGGSGGIMFGGEIDIAFDELRSNGAIKITNMGSDVEMDKLIETAYNKLTTMIFEPIGSGDNIIKDIVKGISGKKSMLDRATDLYKQGQQKPAAKSSTKKTTTDNKSTWLPIRYPHNNRMSVESNVPIHGPSISNTFFALSNQDNWEPKHIKEMTADYVNLHINISNDIKETYLSLIQNNMYCSMTELARVENLNKSNSKNLEFYQQYLLSSSEREKFKTIIDGSNTRNTEYDELIRERIIYLVYKQDFLNEAQKTYILNTFEPDASRSWGLTQSLTYGAWVVLNGNPHPTIDEKGRQMLDKIIELQSSSNESASLKSDIGDSKNQIPIKQDTTKKDDSADLNKIRLDSLILPSDTAKSGNAATVPSGSTNNSSDTVGVKPTDKKSDPKKKTDVKKEENKSGFKMAVMASYQFKKIKQTGKFKINLNKYTSDKLTLRFDENIGSIDCDQCFHQVNLDDPLFKQREIVAMLDGFNYIDFGKYINYVSLKIKKTHQNGDVTFDEVRIDRDNFMAKANNFKLLYGWKGDDNRTKWLDYEYQAQWSFFGGNEVISDWTTANGNAINLSAPYVRKTIELESDPELLKEKEVRSISIKIFYKLFEKEQVEVISMLPSRDQFSSSVDIMLPNGILEYDYEISWRLFGNKTINSGRQKSGEMILFVDEF